MDIALSSLRSVLLGALGGLSAFALAGWLGWMPPSRILVRAPQGAPVVQTVASGAALAAFASSELSSEGARRFIVEAAGASLYDARAAHLVHARSPDPAVQDLAATLLHDHASAWPALSAFAHAHGVALPSAPTPEQRETLALLRDVAGHTRERLFVRHLGVDAALVEIARFEAAFDALDDGDASLRGWIEQTLPALRERAARSQRLLPRVAERRPMA